MNWSASWLLTLASVALGQALQVKNGFLHDRALVWLIAALALVVGAMYASRRSGPADLSARAVLPAFLLAGVLLQVAQLLWSQPLLYSPLRHGWSDPVLAVALAATAVLAVAVAAGGARLRAFAFSAIVVAQLVAGAWVIRTVPSPRIDVVTVNEAAIEAVRAGRSPYSITFRNIYGKDAAFYGEGMATESEVRQGFPYPPLTLAFIAPAQWLLGDYRYALVIALALAAVLIGSIGWTRHAMLAATLLVTTPRILFELEQGWTEPLVVFLLALTVALVWRARGSSAMALGLTLAVKQYLAVALLLAPLLPWSEQGASRKRLLQALAVAAAVTVPFVIRDPYGFIDSVVFLQFREPFRADSLSVLAWLARRGFPVPNVAATLVAAVVALVLALRTLPRSASGFAAGMAVVTCAMFVFGKKAFCNYYFFVLGALAAAIAASGESEDALLPEPRDSFARRGRQSKR